MDKIICLSNHTFDLLHQNYQMGKEKMDVIYNGLSENYFISDKQTLRLKYHIPNIPIILFVGRLHNMKGLTYALQAFKILLKTLTNCHFIIVGNGVFDDYMKECEDIWMHVTWTGQVNKDKLYDLYSVSDIGVIPSFTEQCSYVAIEMMMHGLPMVTTAAPGLAEMTENGVNSLQVPMIEHTKRVEINTELLAEKLLYLLQHPDERQCMGKNARKRYETVYSAEIFRRNMLDFYRSLF